MIWRSIFDTDVPDLYFTARRRIVFGFWITIYEPTPVASSGIAASSPAGALAPSATVGTMLGTCIDSGIAGFTERLYVAHLSTDGWSRQVLFQGVSRGQRS